jgi:hypothetical protein
MWTEPRLEENKQRQKKKRVLRYAQDDNLNNGPLEMLCQFGEGG